MENEIHSAHDIQLMAEKLAEPEQLKCLLDIVRRGEVGNAEQRATLEYFIKGRIKHFNA